MSEPEPPKKRRFWQLHLSTAVLMMLLAGTILYKVSQFRRHPRDLSWDIGWPIDAVTAYPKWNEQNQRVERDDGPFLIKFRYVVDWTSLATDIFIDVGIILSFVFVCEWLICRREGRRP